MPNIRPPGRRFGPVAPGGGAVIGAGLVSAAQALSSFADVQTEIARLDQVQFEKVERSEAIAQFTAKQIQRNNTASQILTQARENRNFEGVQQDMNEWEEGFNQELFQGRSQEFRDVFETIDRSARVDRINKNGTRIEAGRLRIITDNYQISIDNAVESVDEFTTPEEIVEQFEVFAETGVSMGMTQAAVDATAGKGMRDAMKRSVLSRPLVEGLGMLSDEVVAKALGEDERETMRRDLNTKARRIETREAFLSEVHARTTGINVADALQQGESATSLKTRIDNDSSLSPTQQKDLSDIVDVASIARERGPRVVDPEVVKTNEAFSADAVKILTDRADAIRRDAAGRKEDLSPEDMKELISLSDEALAIHLDAIAKNEQGAFGAVALNNLAFDARTIAEELFAEEEVAKKGIFARLAAGDIFAQPEAGNLKSPVAVVGDEIRRMNVSQGRYGGLPSKDRASVAALLINESLQIEDFRQPISTQEANAKAQELFSVIDERFLIEEKGVAPENVEQVKGLVLNSGEPATEPRQQPAVSGIASSIQQSLSNGKTIAEIQEFARTQPGFTQGAFDRAVATLPGIAQEPILEQLNVGQPRALRTSQSGLDFLEEKEAFMATARILPGETKPTIGFGHSSNDFEVGETITIERARELLAEDVAIAESDVEALVPNFERLSENEFNAMVSLLLNAGRTNVTGSKAIAALNEALEGDERDQEAIERFLFEAFDADAGFTKQKNKKGVLVKIRGLVNRRAAERKLFLGTR